jgi:hypothetical protein
LSTGLDPVRAALGAATRVSLFFRDDDVGWGDDRLPLLLERFTERAVPIDLAVIPAALCAPSARRVRSWLETEPQRIFAHQHGFAHRNHEPPGSKKCEFGPSRSLAEQARDLRRGRAELHSLLGARLDPVFTPPWNRLSPETARLLPDLGIRILSRDSAAAPLGVSGLAEIPVSVDWLAPGRGEALAATIRAGGPVGVMLHHAVMTADDLTELDALLELLSGSSGAWCTSIRAIACACGSTPP